MANPFIAMVFGYLKEQGIDTKDMTVQQAIDKFQEMDKGNAKEKGLSINDNNGKITPVEYKRVETAVFDKISTHRKQLEKNGSVIMTVYTSMGKYLVELHNDDDYSFEILRKE